MMRTCAAQDIGCDGVVLVTYIAHTEDAKRYRAPVTFWNDQLASVLGMSVGQLGRARKKAVSEGWLYYEPGGKGRVGKYWSTVPKAFEKIEDGPCDCDLSSVFLFKNDKDNGRQPEEKRKTTGRETETFFPKPIPKPIPKESSTKISSEPDKPTSEPVMVFPVVGKGGSQWGLSPELLLELQGLFPTVDVVSQCRSALAWVLANPGRRKTARGMRKFLTAWIERNINSGTSARASPSTPRQKLDLSTMDLG